MKKNVKIIIDVEFSCEDEVFGKGFCEALDEHARQDLINGAINFLENEVLPCREEFSEKEMEEFKSKGIKANVDFNIEEDNNSIYHKTIDVI